jgi:hypothetical protein
MRDANVPNRSSRNAAQIAILAHGYSTKIVGSHPPEAEGTLGPNALMVKPTRASLFRWYLSGGYCVRPRSESRLRRTTEALLGSSKRSREPRTRDLLFQLQIPAHQRERGSVTSRAVHRPAIPYPDPRELLQIKEQEQ